MAGEWIKMRTNLWDDPRVSNLCDLTGCNEAAVIGGLYWLWATADDHSCDGVMHGLTPAAIARKTGVPNLGAALVRIGWIEETDDGIRLMRFDEHNGASAKKRAETAKRVAKHRSNADVTQSALQGYGDDVTGALAREDKRREEGTNTSLPTSIVIATASANADDWIPKDEAEWLRHLRAKHAFEADPTDIGHRKRYWPVFARWVNAGIRAAQVDAAIAKSYAEATEPIANIVAYADRVLETMAAPKKPKEGAWMATIQAMSAKARELGISDARPGESEAQFKARIINAINERGAA